MYLDIIKKGGVMGLLNTIFDKFKAKLDKTDNALISNNPIELLEQSIKKHQMDLDEKKKNFIISKVA